MEEKRKKINERKKERTKIRNSEGFEMRPDNGKVEENELMLSFGGVPSAEPRMRERCGIGPLWTRMPRYEPGQKKAKVTKTRPWIRVISCSSIIGTDGQI